MRNLTFLILTFLPTFIMAQVMTPEMLWQLERISPVGISDDRKDVLFNSTTFDIEANESESQLFRIPMDGGERTAVEDQSVHYTDPSISPDGKYQLVTQEVKIKPVTGSDFYPKLDKSNVYIYDDLTYRHWDEWEDGKFSHLFIKDLATGEMKDLMEGEPYDCPQQPFGGSDDYTWDPSSSKVVYVTKKEYGTDYAVSTNTDLYEYNIITGVTTNLTEDNEGYDTHPLYSAWGVLGWLQMDEAGYESDKNDIIIRTSGGDVNLTENWDGTVYSFLWGEDERIIYFYAPTNGTRQLFRLTWDAAYQSTIEQITDGMFDVSGLIGQVGQTMVVKRNDMNHAPEIYTVDLYNGEMTQLTHANDDVYNGIGLSRIDKRMVKTTDGKDMVTWVIYPPDFDPNKKYPTLLYCQGGPQGALSQFYSFRWNFQLMAAQGYIVVAPNRRGMPGHGVEWNEQISGDWGGQNMKDYLSAIDDVSQEPYVDTDRLGCVGASYGGYSAFYLAGIHEGRFKSFIAHDGVFNFQSMYGTTEELFFVNKDLGGPYWDPANEESYIEFSPVNHVHKWDTPILIIQGGKDYRVPIGQGLEAFTAARAQGIKSKLLYFPDENHWILTAQNGIIWQREFFKWLDETLIINRP